MPAVFAQPQTATAAAVERASDSAIPAIFTHELSKVIDDRTVLRDVTLRVMPGEFLAVLGSNGAGKSTLLKVLATLVAPSSGGVRLFGKPLTRTSHAVRNDIGLVGHQSMLYRDLSPLENLQFFARLYAVKDPAARARQLLDAVGLSHRANDPVATFSRGMVQRVAIARALVHDPKLILADEPFAGLDAPSAAAVEELLRHLHNRGRTIVLVSHDVEQSLKLADRVVVLRRGAVAADRSTRGTNPAELLETSAG